MISKEAAERLSHLCKRAEDYHHFVVLDEDLTLHTDRSASSCILLDLVREVKVLQMEVIAINDREQKPHR